MSRADYPYTRFIGVDVSKAKLDIAFGDAKSTLSIRNAAESIVTKLVNRLQGSPQTLVVVEATGGYEGVKKGTFYFICNWTAKSRMSPF